MLGHERWFHDRLHSLVRARPRVFHLLRPQLSKALFQRPQQSLAHDGKVRWLHPVLGMRGSQRLEDWNECADISEPRDGSADGSHDHHGMLDEGRARLERHLVCTIDKKGGYESLPCKRIRRGQLCLLLKQQY